MFCIFNMTQEKARLSNSQNLILENYHLHFPHL